MTPPRIKIPAGATLAWYSAFLLTVAVFLIFTGQWVFFTGQASAAVTVGNATQDESGTSPLTIAHTISSTSTDPYLVVGILGASTDLVTDVTYRGASMTLLKKLQNNNGAGRWVYLYGYAPTSTGVGNVVVTASTADFLAAVASSFSDVLKTGSVTGTNPDATKTSYALTVNTSSTGAFFIGHFYADAGGQAAGADTVLRLAEEAGASEAYMSVAPLGAPGSYALNTTMTASNITQLMVELDPTVTAAAAAADLDPVPISGGISDNGGAMSI